MYKSSTHDAKWLQSAFDEPVVDRATERRILLTFLFKVGRVGHERNTLIEDPVADIKILVYSTSDVLVLNTIRFEPDDELLNTGWELTGTRLIV